MVKHKIKNGFQIEVILGMTDAVEATYQYVIWYQPENSLTPIYLCEGQSLFSSIDAAKQAAREWIVNLCETTISNINDI